MRLEDIGLSEELSHLADSPDLSGFVIGRVTREHRERYVVTDGEQEYDAEITGNLRYSAESREDFPAVGDWVAMTLYDSGQAYINKVLPRKSFLARRAVGKTGEIQIIAANIDVAFIVQAISNNFNVNRLERYLAICHSAGIEPVLVLSKTDLVTEKEISAALHELESRGQKVKYLLLSNITLDGIDRIPGFIPKGKTCCVMGSSGVGKSTLINNLLQREIIKTGELSHSTNKGRHVTEHRELFILDNGGIVIDTPGMKEVGMTDIEEGVRTTFREIYDLAQSCRFHDCSHINETGCAVLDALDSGALSRESYENYVKIQREQEHFQATLAEKRKRDKQFGKLIKNYYKNKNKREPE
ncbi:MAG: ribosome small subunit-dependent GTPase A [Bacteroidales bacterium]|nr:ribosome small subunit-dependent GTPase A [Bacteroidales bacterium]